MKIRSRTPSETSRGVPIPESEWDDDVDNCPAVANRDQGDFDHDEIGNLCDPDSDADNVNEVAPDGTRLDNCWLFWNPVQEETGTQRDYDNDGVGFGCDDDELVPRIYVINGMTGTTSGPSSTTRLRATWLQWSNFGKTDSSIPKTR